MTEDANTPSHPRDLERVLACDCSYYPCPHFESELDELATKAALGLPLVTVRDVIEAEQETWS